MVSKRAGVAMFISDKTDFKPKAVTNDKESPYKMMKLFSSL